MRNFLAIFSLLYLVACANSGPPESPPALLDPPEVATSGFETIFIQETIPITLTQLRAFMEKKPVISFLQPTENISNPVDSKVLKGTWGEPEAVRWLRLADGHYVIERILENKPELFRYQVFVFTNAAGRGVEQIVGEQRFIPVDGGTRFEWTYKILPKNFFTRIFIRRQIEEVENYLSSGLEGFSDAARTRANRD